MRTLRYLYDKEYKKMENVAESKKLEQQVDSIIAKMNDTQLNLF